MYRYRAARTAAWKPSKYDEYVKTLVFRPLCEQLCSASQARKKARGPTSGYSNTPHMINDDLGQKVRRALESDGMGKPRKHRQKRCF